MSSQKLNSTKDSLGYRLKQTQHALRLRMDEGLRALNLTTPQYAVLSQLEMRPGISNAALARAAFITPQSMHGILCNLEKSGLIDRKKDPHHGRIIRTELTERGQAVIKECHHCVAQAESIMTNSLSNEDKNRLKFLLEECFNNLHLA